MDTQSPSQTNPQNETATTQPPPVKVKREKHWPGVLFQIYIHSVLLYGLFFVTQAKLATTLFALLLVLMGVLGVTTGSHRLWAHRSYSAHTTLRVILMLCQTLVGQGSIYDWVLDHRIHHKYHGTDDDPFNYKRGFFYAQIGNKVLVPNPRREELIKEIDMSDIEEDKIVMFQKKFYWVLFIIVTALLPINAPVEYWDESILNSVMIVGFLRYGLTLHGAWLVNSARTIWGLVPGDKFYTESNWVYVIRKSYWHEYHYTLPWDYLTGEFGSYNCGCSTTFIKVWAAIGWAYGLRTIDSKGVRRALERAVDTGKSVQQCLNEEEKAVQGYLPDDHYLEHNMK